MSTLDEVADQLRDEFGDRARSIAAVFGPDLTLAVETRLDETCDQLATYLCGDDDHGAAQTAREVMDACWAGHEPPPHWWRSPVGRMIARSIGRDDADAVTQEIAAAMLGVTRGTVSQMLTRADRGQGGSGGLERHPDGGVTRASIMARLTVRP